MSFVASTMHTKNTVAPQVDGIIRYQYAHCAHSRYPIRPMPVPMRQYHVTSTNFVRQNDDESLQIGKSFPAIAILYDVTYFIPFVVVLTVTVNVASLLQSNVTIAIKTFVSNIAIIWITIAMVHAKDVDVMLLSKSRIFVNFPYIIMFSCFSPRKLTQPTANHLNQVQGTMSEDEALSRAIYLSMQESPPEVPPILAKDRCCIN